MGEESLPAQASPMRPQVQRYTPHRRSLTPRSRAPLAVAVHHGLKGPGHQDGVTLIELMLVAGVIAAGTAIIYGVYQNVNAASKTSDEVANLRGLTKNILDSYSSSTNFDALSMDSAIADGLFPEMMVVDGSDPESSWNTPVRVVAADIVQGGMTSSNWGFAIAYDSLPVKPCVQLVSEAGGEFFDVRINGTSVGVGANLDVAQLGELCNNADGADVQFIYAKPLLDTGEGALSLCSENLPGAPETQVVGCPSGQYGLVNQSRSAFCTSAYGAFEWTPWATVSQSCLPCPAPETQTATQTLSCPSGQLGTWTQSRTEERTANCPQPGPNGPTELTSWNAWTGSSSWVDTVNTCAPICVVPIPATEEEWRPAAPGCPTGQFGIRSWERRFTRTASCPQPTGPVAWTAWVQGSVRNNINTCTVCPAPAGETQWVATTGACPTGQSGSQTWEMEQSRTRSYVCPSKSPTLPPASYTPWTNTGATRNLASSCSPTCVAPPQTAVPTSRTANDETQTLNCPSGQVGSSNQSRTRTENGTITTTYTCLAPLGSPVSESSTTWLGTYNAGAWTTTSSTCAACPAPTTETQWIDTVGTCPSGQVGSRSWEMEQSRTRSFTCPAGTLVLPAPSFTPWANTGQTRNLVDTCADACVAPPATSASTTRAAPAETQTVNTCPAGQFGAVNQSRTRTENGTTTTSWVCPAPTGLPTSSASTTWLGTYNNGAWTTTTTTCTTCPAAAVEKQWLDTTGTCPVGQTGSRSWEFEQSRVRSYTCPANSAALPPASYTSWTNTGATRNLVDTCTPTCVAPPQSSSPTSRSLTNQTRTITCVAGEYGNPNQFRTVSENGTTTTTWSCPGPTSSASTAWLGTFVYGTWTTTSNACVACPAPTPQQGTQWKAYTAIDCPAGQYGYSNREKQQIRTRTAGYTCPAGTLTLPAISYTAWSAFSDTGNTRFVSSVCTTCPAPAVQTQWVTSSSACPVGQAGTWTVEREQSRTVYYACPANTAALPAASYSLYTDTGATRNEVNTCAPACTAPGDSFEYEPIYFCGGGTLISPGSRRRTVSWTCPGPTPVYSAWVVEYPATCSGGGSVD